MSVHMKVVFYRALYGALYRQLLDSYGNVFTFHYATIHNYNVAQLQNHYKR